MHNSKISGKAMTRFAHQGKMYGLSIFASMLVGLLQAHAQSFYNASMYVAPSATMTDFGTDAIFGPSSDVEIEGNINILCNNVYMDAASATSGAGSFTILDPSTASLPWSTHALDANGATVGAELKIETAGIQMQNLSYAGITAAASFDILISNKVQFNTGVVTAGTGLFHFLAGSVHAGSSINSYVNGNVRKTGNTAFTFPVGDAALFAPMGISAPSSISDHFTSKYYNDDPHTFGFALDPSLALVSSCEYWDLQRTGGSSSVNVSLFWENVRSCGVTDPSLLRVAHWNGSLWQDKGNVTYSGSASSGNLTSIVNSSFSPFTLASTSIVNPLPVSLDYFTAECKDPRNVTLKWRTLSEINNDYFQLEQSYDLQEWTVMSTQNGAGNSNTAIEYSSVVDINAGELAYYRLRQVDYDGQFKLYEPVSIQCGEDAVPVIFPNPVAGESFYVRLPKTENDNWDYDIYTSDGKLCQKGSIMNTGSEQAINTFELSFGTYYVTLQNSTGTFTYPLIIIKQ